MQQLTPGRAPATVADNPFIGVVPPEPVSPPSLPYGEVTIGEVNRVLSASLPPAPLPLFPPSFRLTKVGEDPHHHQLR